MDAERFTDIFSRLHSRLRQLAVHIVGNEDEASDAVQDTFLSLWRRREELADEGKIDRLMTVSIKNRCLSEKRLQSRNVLQPLEDFPDSLQQGEFTPGEEEESQALYVEVERIMKSYLTERDREILFLREKYGYDFDEIAAKYQMTPAAVRMALSRARKGVLAAYRKHHNS